MFIQGVHVNFVGGWNDENKACMQHLLWLIHLQLAAYFKSNAPVAPIEKVSQSDQLYSEFTLETLKS
jgi:hypothetical protein